MKKPLILSAIITLLFFSINSVHAQNLSEKLGAIQTNFIITSHGVEVEITNQVIAKRAERFYEKGGISEGGYGYGYGYESFHLEFTARNGTIDLPQPGSLLRTEKRIILDFFDEDDNLLGSRAKALREVRNISNNSHDNQLTHYSIDLITIPLPLLDATKRIDIYRE